MSSRKISLPKVNPERIQKVLAQTGLGSRRAIEGWIREGRIKIGNRVAEIGEKITPNATIYFDNKPVSLNNPEKKKTRLLIYHKPEGEVCTRSDPEQRPTVFERLPRLKYERWIVIGRLDINSTGLLLFTNDGELAHRLMHPSSHVEREYAVRIYGEVTPEMLQQLKKGVGLEDGPARFDKIEKKGGEGTNQWFHVIIQQGRNRIIRRLWESQGVTVSRLTRIRFGNILLPRGLPRGKYQELDPAIVQVEQIKPLQKTKK